MKNSNDYDQAETLDLNFRPRETEAIKLDIPIDTLHSLEKIANSRDMSIHALLKFYIGQGLRQDLSQLFSARMLQTTEQVLERHLQSKEEVTSIIREIKSETYRTS